MNELTSREIPTADAPTAALCPPPAARSGFTLLEVMVSVALVLMLILGVNQVFSLTSRAVSTGNTLAEAYRNDRAVQGTIYEDMRSAVIAGAPCFIIRSERTYAFRNPQDEQGDEDGNKVSFTASDGVKAVPAFAMNHRSHRIDRVGFFARNKFYRQTGPNGQMVLTDANGIPESSSEAWIRYGLLQLPDNSGAWTADTWPGAGTAVTNPNNYYAAQWVLGRSATLLIQNPLGTAFQGDTSGLYTPLSGENILNCRFDVAATTMRTFREKLDTQYQKDKTGFKYYSGLIQDHYQAQPNPQRPLTSSGAAKAVPAFLNGCTQFAVEYAGDFMTQRMVGTDDQIGKPVVSGTYTSADGGGNYSVPDGVIDFIFIPGKNPTTGAREPSLDQRKTCWYGFPRDANSDGAINATYASPDVLPLMRRLNAADSGATFAQPRHERDTVPAASPAAAALYYAAWGPDTINFPGTTIPYPQPKMIRFLVTVDDFGNRISEPQTFEYIMDVQ